MNKLRKLTCLLLALMMVFAMTATASAADGESTITAPTDSTRTYKVYQIFTGDLGENKVLSNVKWGQNSKLPEGKAVGDSVDETVLKALTSVNSTSEKEILTEIEKYVDLNSTPIGEVSNGSTLSVANGYYLIKDVGPVNAAAGEAYGRYVVKIVGNTTITPKDSKVTFEKKVQDTNDTTGDTSLWQDSADYDIGDSVPFQLTGTVADDFKQYTSAYYFAFHDKMDESLDFVQNSVEVYVGSTLITDGYSLSYTPHTFDLVFDDLRNVAGVTAGSKITVEFKATLNASAKLGNQGNVNDAQLEYSNNPYSEQRGTTNWDSVIVFTYQVVVNKYANEAVAGKEKAGAAFKLEKLVGQDWKLVNEFQADENTSTFTFKGLDDGKYRLTETVTPSGFNTIDPIEFTVTADHKVTWEGEARTTILTSLNGAPTEAGLIEFTPNVESGTLSTDVINKSGSTLPETGGMGTTLFYVLGGVLVLAAVVLLVTKKRMRSEN